MKFYNPDLGLLLLRLGIGVIFIYHGIIKLSNMSDTVGFFASIGVGVFFTWVVALVETIGGVAMIIGFMSRIFAKLLAFTMIMAIVLVKAKTGFQGMEIDIILLASCLTILFAGPGKYTTQKVKG